MIYIMICPECGYSYRLDLQETYEVEHCPCCGHSDKFSKFDVGA